MSKERTITIYKTSAVGKTECLPQLVAPTAKPMRQAMPTVAAWVDELRAAFGADTINAAIRDGVAGGAGFFAVEGGQTIGRDHVPGRVEVNLADMILAKQEKETR